MNREECGYYQDFCKLVSYGDLIECNGICPECDCYIWCSKEDSNE